MQSSRVLVIESDPSLRESFQQLLCAAGYRVWAAADGRSARQLVQQHGCPDLVLAALLLPDEDSASLVRYLRSLPGAESVPVLAVSGSLTLLQAARVNSCGFNDFLLKPLGPAQLVEAVRRCLPDHEPAPITSGNRPSRVLLVDDNAVQRKLLLFRLRDRGLEVEWAADGKEALEMLSRWRPDIVVSDVLMPRMDGFQLCHAIRRQPALAGLPVILISCTCPEEEDRRLGQEVGANRFLHRTADLSELLVAVRECLDGGELPPQAGLHSAAGLSLQGVVSAREANSDKPGFDHALRPTGHRLVIAGQLFRVTVPHCGRSSQRHGHAGTAGDPGHLQPGCPPLQRTRALVLAATTGAASA